MRPVLMDTNVLFMYPFSFRLDTIFEKPVAKKPHLDTLHAVKNYSMSCGTGLNGYNWTKLSTPVFLVSQCLKITKKSHSTLRAKRATFTFWVDKMQKMVHFGEFLKVWSLRSNSSTRPVTFCRKTIENVR